jgi:glycosyltransferase involved in cell wall biosynthesis
MEMIPAGKTPVISVVIPAYNTASLIAICLDSVFAQTLRDFEVIVINDGSPDTDQLEKNLAPYSGHIRYLKQPNRGPSAARNLGIRESRGQYVAFLDSDDYWFLQHLEVQMKILQNDPQLGLVYGDSLLIRNGEIIGRTFDREEQILPVTFEALLTERCTVSTSTTVALRQALMEAGLFDESMNRSEDFDLWLRMAFRGTRMTHHREIHVGHTLSGSGLSSDGYLMTRARMDVLAKVRTQLPLSPSTLQVLDQHYREIEAGAHLHQLKEFIRTGQFESALDSARGAASIQPTWKLRLSISFLQYAPRLLRIYYSAHEKLLAVRNKARAARSARELKAALPSLSMKARSQ